MASRNEHRVSLHLPVGVVIPQFYVDEQDAGTISRALQLGADGVLYLRKQATELALQELTEQAMSERSQRVEYLQAELVKVREEVERRVEQQKLDMVKGLLPLHAQEVARLHKACEKLSQERLVNLADLEKQRATARQLDAGMQSARKEERQNAVSDVEREMQVRESQVTKAEGNLTSLLSQGEKKRTEESRQLKQEQDKTCSVGTQPPTKRFKQVLQLQTSLSDLIRNVFGKLDGFHISSEPKGVVTARIHGLLTKWYCRDKVPAKVEEMVRQLKTHLQVSSPPDVAFLVGCGTGVAKHTDHVLDVDFVQQHHALVYVNQLTEHDDLHELLDRFVMPLIKVLRCVKQEYAASNADTASRLKDTVSHCAEARETLEQEAKDLVNDRLLCQKRFEARQNWIDKGKAALQTLLEEMCRLQTQPKATDMECEVTAVQEPL